MDLEVHGLELGGLSSVPPPRASLDPQAHGSQTLQLEQMALDQLFLMSLLITGAEIKCIVTPSLGPNHKPVLWKPPQTVTFGPRCPPHVPVDRPRGARGEQGDMRHSCRAVVMEG